MEPVSDISRHYQILGLEFGADHAAIKKAYHRLALQWHPDKQGCSPEDRSHATSMFQAVQRAYEALTTACLHAECGGQSYNFNNYRKTMDEMKEQFEQVRKEREKERQKREQERAVQTQLREAELQRREQERRRKFEEREREQEAKMEERRQSRQERRQMSVGRSVRVQPTVDEYRSGSVLRSARVYGTAPDATMETQRPASTVERPHNIERHLPPEPELNNRDQTPRMPQMRTNVHNKFFASEVEPPRQNLPSRHCGQDAANVMRSRCLRMRLANVEVRWESWSDIDRRWNNAA
eukprot:gnl/MRDRNA2_/MRDRNA2_34933_c0_seq1.p1 gnl/MRDRNA2_/MRDRNA2_34933_c0~~gnl/MRDRNA2_/MRDRNA2_34933_c0_seq1.p1  ORF type:complete len:295 (+),score=49.63 gnl/MRDRNA2_/MRDRNA2_34933_c0_seq1:62-946(+)